MAGASAACASAADQVATVSAPRPPVVVRPGYHSPVCLPLDLGQWNVTTDAQVAAQAPPPVVSGVKSTASRSGSLSIMAGRVVCYFGSPRYSDNRLGGLRMFDVYLNNKRDLLVVPNGLPIRLPDASGKWHKKKKVASVSEDIRLAVQRQGYYLRKLTDFKKR